MKKTYKAMSVLVTVVTAISLGATVAQGSEQTPGSNVIKPNIELSKTFVCPKELQWRVVRVIPDSGMDFDNRHYVPVNPTEFKANMPGALNRVTTSGALPRPQLKDRQFIMNPNHNLELHCIYEYQTVASAVTTSVTGSQGWKLAIKTDTGKKVNNLQIQNDASHKIDVVVFPSDSSGKITSKQSSTSFTVAPKALEKGAQFLSDEKTPYFSIQVQYEGFIGYVECPYQQSGGTFYLNFEEKTLGNTCTLKRIGS